MTGAGGQFSTARLPAHWDLLPSKRLFRIVGGSTPRSDSEAYWDGNVVWVTPSDLDGARIARLRTSLRTITEEGLESCGTTLVPPGSIVLSTRAPIGSLGVADVILCTNQGCKSLVPLPDVCTDFYAYAFSICTEELRIRGKGTTFLELSLDELGSFAVPAPRFSEQQAIAEFLDRETGKIDALVEEQRRLIELLKEKRQAVISHAVTKGLNPDAPMKPSGIPWLGDVPAHWEAVQLGRICTKVSDGPHFSPRYLDEGVMFLSARNIRVDGWSLDDAKFISEEDYDEFSRRVVPERGDVLYTKGGTTGIAKVVDLEERFQVWVHVAVLKIRLALASPHYTAFALNSLGCYEQSQLYTRGATNKDLGLTRMVKIWMALPPLSEQVEIANYLHRQTGAIDLLLHEGEQTIRLLLERRAALISAAVTGKIDLRTELPAVTDTKHIRAIVAAEIIGHLAHRKNFGRVKLQKLLYLAEADAGVGELQGNYERAAAGPLDRSLIDGVERALTDDGWMQVDQGGKGGPVRYRIVGGPGAHRYELRTALGEERFGRLEEIIEDLGSVPNRDSRRYGVVIQGFRVGGFE